MTVKPTDMSAQRDIFTRLIAQLKRARITPEQLLERCYARGMSTAHRNVLDGPEALILLESAVELSRDPCFVLKLGQSIGIESYGTFGFALISSANQRETIAMLERYGKVFFRPSWQSFDHNNGLLLRMIPAAGTEEQQQLIVELAFSQLISIGISLHRQPPLASLRQTNLLAGAELQFSYSEPKHASYYEYAFPIPMRFNCEYNQLFIPASLLDIPVKTANPTEHVVFLRQCEEMLQSLDSVEKTSTEVRVLLIQSAGQFLNITQVAKRLDTSERTLRRRLSSESTSFREILDEIRNLLAREYLTKTRLIVAEIAYLLNYEETGNFRRAFKRWNGMTPNDYRQSHA